MSSRLNYPVGTSVDEPVSAEQIRDIDGLREWMQDSIARYEDKTAGFDSKTPHGRVYIARTIQYQSNTGLAQTGSAPSFFDGVWSLATCKKGMRGEPIKSDTANSSHPFQKLFREPNDESVRRPRYPVFVLSCASRKEEYNVPEKADSHRNWLASVAMVTHGFDAMEDYGQYLRRTYEGDAVRHRLTHASNPTSLALNRGDCHVDDSGVVQYPPADHQHGDGGQATEDGCSTNSSPQPSDHIDNSENHVKCVSEPGHWLGWTEPQFALKPKAEFNQKYRSTDGFDDLLKHLESVCEDD